MMTKSFPKVSHEHFCECCDYHTSKTSSYNKHLLTAKHKKMTNDDQNLTNISAAYSCACGKEYSYRQGLHAHKKKCSQKSEHLGIEKLQEKVIKTLAKEVHVDK